MKYNEKTALRVIVEAAQNYDKFLKNKNFLVVFQKGKEMKSVEIGFHDYHFLHLTGIRTNLKAKQFYSACLNRKISPRDIALDAKGNAQRKLAVLPYLHELLYQNCMIGDFIQSGIQIKADYFVGNTRAVLSVGFRYGSGTKAVDIPVTLYKEDVRRQVRPVCKVVAIFVKGRQEEQYAEHTYWSKGQDYDTLHFSGRGKVESKEVGCGK